MKRKITKVNMLKSLFIILGIALIFSLAGCGAMIHNAVLKSATSFNDVEQKWPPIKKNEGRVVVYYPRLPAAGFSIVGGGGYDSRRVTVDNKYKASLMDQTFMFIDLDVGKHSVIYKGHMYKKKKIDFDLSEDEIKFIKITWTQTKSPPPEIVPEKKARKELLNIKHNFKKPVPFDSQ